MPKKQRKYNPHKLKTKTYPFSYEIRIWSGTTTEGKIKDAYGFTFPVVGTLTEADKYAFDLSVTIWGRLTLGMVPKDATESAELLEAILPAESIEIIDRIRENLQPPCYGQLVRLSNLVRNDEEIRAQFGTVNDGNWQIIETIDCAKATIQRLSA